MKKKIHIALLIILALSFILSSSSCSDGKADIKRQKDIICENLYINDVSGFTFVESEYKEKDNGDVEQYYVIQFDDESGRRFTSQINTISIWKNVPVQTDYYNIYAYITMIPECTIKRASDTFSELNKSNTCIYFFKDRSYIYKIKNKKNLKNDVNSLSVKNTGILGDGIYSDGEPVPYYNYATNFSLAFFDKSDYKLYIYVCDREYVKDIYSTIEAIN